MVLDTKGINVWCAAGKGTFGTDEIIKRIESTKLAEVVNTVKSLSAARRTGSGGAWSKKAQFFSGDIRAGTRP